MVPAGALSCTVVYGREPLPGRVKTRLAADLGDEAAARVYAVLLEHALTEAGRAAGHAVLSLAAPASAAFRERSPLPVEVQERGALGDRLAATFTRRFAEGWGRVVVVGSDCPGMTAAHLEAAAEALLRAPAVLGPAGDGGYWLVGQRAPGVDLFSGIPWSAPGTLAATRSRLQDLGVGWVELELLEDIDTAADLQRALRADRLPPALRAAIAEAASG